MIKLIKEQFLPIVNQDINVVCSGGMHDLTFHILNRFLIIYRML